MNLMITWEELFQIASSISFTKDNDDIIWKYEFKGTYSVHSLYAVVNLRGVVPVQVPTVWKLDIPPDHWRSLTSNCRQMRGPLFCYSNEQYPFYYSRSGNFHWPGGSRPPLGPNEAPPMPQIEFISSYSSYPIIASTI